MEPIRLVLVIDLRSDTVSKPTAQMRDFISAAKVGDDVFGDDELTNSLQEKSARMLGKESALFVPSGTMANQISLRTHTEPGDEIILEKGSHIYMYEGGSYAALSGLSVGLVKGERGIMGLEGIKSAIRPPGGLSHYPKTKLICVENTANAGGGTVYPLDILHSITELAKVEKLKTHLDGARIFNASIQSGNSAKEIAEGFDSVSFCLSKGLGCPVGSLLCGSKEFIDRAHRFRKMFGGAMRQTGLLAAAGLFALDNNINRLKDDHRRAKELGECLSCLGYEVNTVETNMLYINVDKLDEDIEDVVESLKKADILIHPASNTHLRAVFHIGINDDDLSAVKDAFTNLCTF